MKFKRIINLINQGKTILYPTDTIYGIGCDATNPTAVSKIYKLKNRVESKSLIILVSNFEMLEEYVANVPNRIRYFLKTTTKPTTVIYNNPINLAENVIAKDNTIAVRIVKEGFVNELLNKFKKPIVSTSANISGEPTPINFESISQKIKDNVDFIVSLPIQTNKSKPSQIIKIVDDQIVFLRK